MTDRRTVKLSRRAFIVATAVLAAGCFARRAGRTAAPGRRRTGRVVPRVRGTPRKTDKNRYPDIAVDVIPTEGSVENLALLRSADADMGLALADVTERDRATGPIGTAPQAVARVYENYLQVVVRDAAPVRQLADLEGLRVSIGPPARALR